MKNLILIIICISSSFFCYAQDNSNLIQEVEKSNSIEKDENVKVGAVDIDFRGKRNNVRYDNYSSCKEWNNACMSGDVVLPGTRTCRDAISCKVVNGTVIVEFPQQDISPINLESASQETKLKTQKLIEKVYSVKIKNLELFFSDATIEKLENCTSCSEASKFYKEKNIIYCEKYKEGVITILSETKPILIENSDSTKIQELVTVSWDNETVTVENYETCEDFYIANPNKPLTDPKWFDCSECPMGVLVKWRFSSKIKDDRNIDLKH